jgi:hypothetical protein
LRLANHDVTRSEGGRAAHSRLPGAPHLAVPRCGFLRSADFSNAKNPKLELKLPGLENRETPGHSAGCRSRLSRFPRHRSSCAGFGLCEPIQPISESFSDVSSERCLELSDERFNLVKICCVEIHRWGGCVLPSFPREVSEAFM